MDTRPSSVHNERHLPRYPYNSSHVTSNNTHSNNYREEVRLHKASPTTRSATKESREGDDLLRKNRIYANTSRYSDSSLESNPPFRRMTESHDELNKRKDSAMETRCGTLPLSIKHKSSTESVEQQGAKRPPDEYVYCRLKDRGEERRADGYSTLKRSKRGDGKLKADGLSSSSEASLANGYEPPSKQPAQESMVLNEVKMRKERLAITDYIEVETAWEKKMSPKTNQTRSNFEEAKPLPDVNKENKVKGKENEYDYADDVDGNKQNVQSNSKLKTAAANV